MRVIAPENPVPATALWAGALDVTGIILRDIDATKMTLHDMHHAKPVITICLDRSVLAMIISSGSRFRMPIIVTIRTMRGNCAVMPFGLLLGIMMSIVLAIGVRAAHMLAIAGCAIPDGLCVVHTHHLVVWYGHSRIPCRARRAYLLAYRVACVSDHVPVA